VETIAVRGGHAFSSFAFTGANDEKVGLLDRYPGLRPLRGLTRGYPLVPFQGWGFETDAFYRAIENLRYIPAFPSFSGKLNA
jgi:hypothetical protein